MEDIRDDLTKIFSERNEVVTEDSDLTVTFQDFIEWFFVGRSDYINFPRALSNH